MVPLAVGTGAAGNQNDSFGLPLADLVVHGPVGDKRFQSHSGSAGICHVSHNALKEKEHEVTLTAAFKMLTALQTCGVHTSRVDMENANTGIPQAVLLVLIICITTKYRGPNPPRR